MFFQRKCQLLLRKIQQSGSLENTRLSDKRRIPSLCKILFTIDVLMVRRHPVGKEGSDFCGAR